MRGTARPYVLAYGISANLLLDFLMGCASAGERWRGWRDPIDPTVFRVTLDADGMRTQWSVCELELGAARRTRDEWLAWMAIMRERMRREIAEGVAA